MKKAGTAIARSPRPQAVDRKRNEKHAAEASVFIDHDLERAIPYLVARAGIRMGQAFSKELKPFGLTLTEWRVCAALHHKPHQRLAELATHTSAEPSTLSRTVEGLLQRGLLIRDRSGDDARALALSLTPEGDALAQRIIPLAQLYDRVALSGISATQVDLLRDMLRRIYSNIETLDKGS
ncbi:MarR family winged helix-turn-helix transcriptional regulator [Ramlibacter sp. WS9]|uniref:MarR family winged helix-turn-helix transcriptional regulator n=1 Tax=Ramlibacter sp. WS9 TaxID=1882741 RepID=UPI0011429CDC|nr:MarR family transcriptional regulator [Ramlibacter sp. WS9]